MGGTPGSAALQTIFGVLQGIAGDIQSGLLTVVAPIAIAVCLYFLVRMLLASDAKDVATYRKRCITTAIIVVVAFTIPGLISVMKNLGTVINGQLEGVTVFLSAEAAFGKKAAFSLNGREVSENQKNMWTACKTAGKAKTHSSNLRNLDGVFCGVCLCVCRWYRRYG